MRTRKSWREKMDKPGLPKVVDIPPKMQKRFGAGSMLIPSPHDVDAAIRAVRKGQVISVGQIARDLAMKYTVHATCPMVTGIHVRIAAEVAEEDARAGKTRITPYWRVVRENGALNPKFPGGMERQAERLRAEGVTVVKGKGKTAPRVVTAPEPCTLS